MPRYERILPLIGIVLMGLALILLVQDIPALTFVIPLPGEFEAQISIAWLILFFLLIVTAAGTETVQREDVDAGGERSLRLHPVAWITPVLLTLTSFLFLRLLQSLLERSIGLAVTGALLLAILIAQHYSRDEHPRVQDLSHQVLDLLVYIDAFFLYGAVYNLKMRSLFSATLIVVVTFLLAYVLLWRLAPRGQVRLYAAIVGLGVGEVTWPLNYWAISGLIGGAFLLVVFYGLLNPARHHLRGTLTRQVALEYALVVLLAVVLIGAYVFWLAPLLGVRV